MTNHRQHDPVADRVLAWYDRNRRDLPWRAPPGQAGDPYRVWLSEIMLQQTTVVVAGRYYAAFPPLADARQPRGGAADAVLAAWAGLGYYARARNLHACARVVVRDHGGRLPASEAGLMGLPGIGRYTAAAIAAIAFDVQAAAVDANVERVVARLAAIDMPLPEAKPLIRAAARAGAGRPARRFCPGDDGSRRPDLHAAAAELPGLPGGRALRRPPSRCPEGLPVKRRRG